MIIDKINCPSDLRNCTTEELKILASEMREAIVKKVNKENIFDDFFNFPLEGINHFIGTVAGDILCNRCINNLTDDKP